MRLFVAIFPPETVVRGLTARLAPARNLRSVRLAGSEDLHITLKFLGSTPAESVPAVLAAVERAAAGAAPFALSFATFGTFPPSGRPSVFWIGVQSAAALGELASVVDRETASLGYPLETRAFRPHVTVARGRSEARRPALTEAKRILQQSLDGYDSGPFSVDHVWLVRSDTGPVGARYTRLESRALQAAP